MIVLSVDGILVSKLTPGSLPLEPIREAELLEDTGGTLHIEPGSYPIGESPMKVSLWALGGMFALIGAMAVLRRGDLRVVKLFGIFAGANALALAVAPSSGSTGPVWALMLQVLTVIAVGASFLPFISALLYEPIPRRYVGLYWITLGMAGILVAGYVFAVTVRPNLYELVRPLAFLYFIGMLLWAVLLLVYKAIESGPVRYRQQARIALLGVATGTFPFVGLTLVPGAFGQDPLLPNHITILAWGLIPAAFAFAILQYQSLGIRRLVHRGMVYTLVSFVLLSLIVGALWLAVSQGLEISHSGESLLLLAILIVAGVALFGPLRRIAYSFVDSVLYRDSADFQTVLVGMQQQIRSVNPESDMEASLARRLVDAFNLESVLIFLSHNSDQEETPVMAGQKAFAVFQQVRPYIDSLSASELKDAVSELQWQGDFLLVAPLISSGQRFGLMVLGPKNNGESFADEEKRMMATLTPLLALAFEKAELSQELRGVNQKLVEAGEAERSRIAGDLHDGPLQKAILLGQMKDWSLDDRMDILKQLVSEIREIGSRLRPSVLDDLGIGPALEWLVEGMTSQSGLEVEIMFDGVDDDQRFQPQEELALFRVAQESLNNVMKHAGSSQVRVSLAKTNDKLVLKIVDNGTGFIADAGRPGGLGLPGMRERMLQVIGDLNIESGQDSGTTITATLPLGK